VVQIFILNRDQLANATTAISSLSTALSGFLRRTNTLSNARLNVSAHYDISNDMFAGFLSPDMTYSCPIWLPTDHARSGQESLEEAQNRKLDRVIDKAKIKSSDHVLEIGTGWGSFAIRAVQKTGCRVTSLTLSREQKELAEKFITAAGVADHIDVQLCDYRALPLPPDGPYDKIVSIEMLEAVGAEFLTTYFECVHQLLRPEHGIAVFQCITMPETRYEGYARGEDFIRRYIFPGGHLPSVSQLVGSIDNGSRGQLIVEGVENIGGHYAKTLRLWKEKFLAHFDAYIHPALVADHADMTDGDVALFKRKWEVSNISSHDLAMIVQAFVLLFSSDHVLQYYFTYSEAGFHTKTLGDVIITVGREGATELLEGIPM
jgi:cyclopropane-fatty-acyl-phospholipid synthase